MRQPDGATPCMPRADPRLRRPSPTAPPWEPTMASTIARPSPAPPWVSGCRRPRSGPTPCSSHAGGNPGPSSATSTTAGRYLVGDVHVRPRAASTAARSRRGCGWPVRSPGRRPARFRLAGDRDRDRGRRDFRRHRAGRGHRRRATSARSNDVGGGGPADVPCQHEEVHREVVEPIDLLERGVEGGRGLRDLPCCRPGMRASSSSPRAIEIGVRSSWLASSRNTRSCSSAASIRSRRMVEPTRRAPRALSSVLRDGQAPTQLAPAAREITSASSIISCTGDTAAPARNHPAKVTRPASSGRPTASASSRRCWARVVSSSVVPTTITSPCVPDRARPQARPLAVWSAVVYERDLVPSRPSEVRTRDDGAALQRAGRRRNHVAVGVDHLRERFGVRDHRLHLGVARLAGDLLRGGEEARLEGLVECRVQG